jgi:TatA/E family protein of Tat protein translocase
VILFGPGKLPEFGKALGDALRGFRKALNGAEEKPAPELEKDKQRNVSIS